jgi:hypothetical protein
MRAPLCISSYPKLKAHYKVSIIFLKQKSKGISTDIIIMVGAILV